MLPGKQFPCPSPPIAPPTQPARAEIFSHEKQLVVAAARVEKPVSQDAVRLNPDAGRRGRPPFGHPYFLRGSFLRGDRLMDGGE